MFALLMSQIGWVAVQRDGIGSDHVKSVFINRILNLCLQTVVQSNGFSPALARSGRDDPFGRLVVSNRGLVKFGEAFGQLRVDISKL